MDLIEKLPISMGTRASKAKKDELYRKLDEIEETIFLFKLLFLPLKVFGDVII